MPSFALSQFADAEEAMCKQLLSLDLREQKSAPPALSLAMKTPGYVGQPRTHTLFPFPLSTSSASSSSPSQHSTESLDAAFLPSSHWLPKPESLPPPHGSASAQWGKSGFWAARSLSMVETGSAAAGPLDWPGNEAHCSLGGPGAAPLSAASASSLQYSTSPGSSGSSTRYKTELCRSFAESGVCKYGSKCQFAHGGDELRDLNRHPKYKTEPCRTFHTIGFCPYGIRCHFVHNNEEEQKHSLSCSSSSSTCAPSSSASSPRSGRPPLLRQSFSFAGFPSAPMQGGLHTHRHPPPHLPPPASLSSASFLGAPSGSPPSCADISELFSQALLEMDWAFEASAAHPPQLPAGQPSASAADSRSQFLPSPDSGCSLGRLSPAASPALGQSPGVVCGGFMRPLGARSLSYTSLSEQDQDQDGSGGSSASSLSGSDSCSVAEGIARRLAVFSQLSVPEDGAGFSL